MCVCVLHIQTVEVPRYQTNARTPEELNMDLRILYILNEITEDVFCTKIQQREKALEKCRDIFDVLQLITQVGADKYREAVLSGQFDDCKATLKELFNYANTTLNAISRTYGCVVPNIEMDALNIVFRRA